MSLPGEKALSPAPRMTMQRSESSAESSLIRAPRRTHIGFVIAFSFSGRLSVTVAMPSSRCTRMRSGMGAGFLEG